MHIATWTHWVLDLDRLRLVLLVCELGLSVFVYTSRFPDYYTDRPPAPAITLVLGEIVSTTGSAYLGPPTTRTGVATYWHAVKEFNPNCHSMEIQ